VIAFLLLAAAATPSAIDAEQAFARDAKRIGLWTAFRKYADKDAVMFAPRAVRARDFLVDRKDPPKSISWRAADSFVSCDGGIAVNTGPWFTPDGKRAGYFTTVWKRSGGSWHWIYDGGVPKPATTESKSGAQVHRASCTPHPKGAPISLPTNAKSSATLKDSGSGQSADKTLAWEWKVSAKGARTFRVFQWSKGRYAEVINAVDPAP
jgi:hypothetical protein